MVFSIVGERKPEIANVAKSLPEASLARHNDSDVGNIMIYIGTLLAVSIGHKTWQHLKDEGKCLASEALRSSCSSPLPIAVLAYLAGKCGVVQGLWASCAYSRQSPPLRLCYPALRYFEPVAGILQLWCKLLFEVYMETGPVCYPALRAREARFQTPRHCPTPGLQVQYSSAFQLVLSRKVYKPRLARNDSLPP